MLLLKFWETMSLHKLMFIFPTAEFIPALAKREHIKNLPIVLRKNPKGS